MPRSLSEWPHRGGSATQRRGWQEGRTRLGQQAGRRQFRDVRVSDFPPTPNLSPDSQVPQRRSRFPSSPFLECPAFSGTAWAGRRELGSHPSLPHAPLGPPLCTDSKTRVCIYLFVPEMKMSRGNTESQVLSSTVAAEEPQVAQTGFPYLSLTEVVCAEI